MKKSLLKQQLQEITFSIVLQKEACCWRYLETDFENQTIERKQLYSPGDIQDLKVKQVDSTLINIFITYNNGNRFVLGKFEYRKLSVTFKQYPFVDRNVLHSELIAAEEPIIYYWKEHFDTLYYKKAVIKTGPNEYKNIIHLPKTDQVVFSSYLLIC